MKAGNLVLDGDRAYYTYRGKGGKQGHRELPQPALNAIRASLAAFGKDLATMPQRSHYGHHYRTIVKASPAEHSTATCRDTFERPEFLLLEYISFDTLPPNYGGMPGRRWKTSAGFWTIVAWR